MKKNLIKGMSLAWLVLLVSGPGCKTGHDKNDIELSGTMELTEHGVGVPVTGRITSLKVDEGDEVKMGQLIATTERFDQTARDYNRLYQLRDKGGANQQQVEQAELAMLDQRVLSPVNGVVLTKVHDTGEVIDAKSPIVIIGDRSQLWVKVFVPEGLINQVHMNQPATIHFDGLTKEYQGHVTYISPEAEFTPRNVQTPEERVTQTFAVKVTLDQVEPFLRPGVAADVTLHLGKGNP
jgi:multidrug resistance efflux pump